MIDINRRLLFIHIARTGGTSIETALVGKDWWEIEPESKHISAAQARAKYGDTIWNTFCKFSIVRNPWDRIVSLWATGWWWDQRTHLRGIKPSTLKDFILSLQPHPNEHYDSLHYHEILNEELDFILRFESLQADFATMMNRLGVPEILLPHVERRDRKHYREFYDDETAALVGSLFAKDIRDYGYSF